MSVAFNEWAYTVKGLKTRERAVLAAIARRVDDTGRYQIKMPDLEEDACVTRKTLRGILDILAADRHLLAFRANTYRSKAQRSLGKAQGAHEFKLLRNEAEIRVALDEGYTFERREIDRNTPEILAPQEGVQISPTTGLDFPQGGSSASQGVGDLSPPQSTLQNNSSKVFQRECGGASAAAVCSPSRKRKSKIGEDWQPNETTVVFGEGLGLTRTHILGACLRKFRFLMQARNEAFYDWDARYNSWLMDEAQPSRPAYAGPSTAAVQAACVAQATAVSMIDARRAAIEPTSEFHRRVIEGLERKLGRTVFVEWFDLLEVVAVEREEATFALPSKFKRDWVEKHYHQKMLVAAQEADPAVSRITLVVRQAARAPPARTVSA